MAFFLWVEIDDIETGVGGGDWLIERPELPQDAISFLKTLRCSAIIFKTSVIAICTVSCS